MLCWAAGGPQKYTGKDMESSHRHLRITPGEWDAFMDDLAQTLDKFDIPAAERAEVRGHRREHPALDRRMSPMLAGRVISLRCQSLDA
jgi:truncated hemoglobin YjbI